MFARPGPETTRSTSTRPYSFDQGAGERLFVGVARCEVDVSAFRRARHEPPIDPRQQGDAESGARGDQRDAALGVGVSLVENVDLVIRENRHRPRERFEIVEQVGARNGTSLRSVSRSTTHGTFVNCARVPVIGPATPKLAASMSAGLVDVSRRNCETQRAEIGEVERAIGAGFDGGGAPGARARKRPRKVFVPPTSPASSIADDCTARKCLTSTRPYCIFLAR